MSSSPFSFSGWPAGQVPTVFTNQYTFRREEDSISVREEHVLPHSGVAVSRARCTETGVEFDLRRLRLGAESGGLVMLAKLEALERESRIAMASGSHPHIVRCHATLVENLGTDHSRLFLCDPCCVDMAAHLKAYGGALPAESVTEIGQQLSLGLRHLHSLDILCGSVTPHGVLLGCDGKWKLNGELGAAAELPCSLEEWRLRYVASSSQQLPPPPLPPEARPPEAGHKLLSSGQKLLGEAPLGHVTPALDIWMLGALLAGLLEGVDARGIGGARSGNAVLAASEEVLLCPLAARLWMLVHWLLATEPLQRPWTRRLVTLLHSLSECLPQDLLIEMPEYARFHCQGMAAAAARKLAFAGLSAAGGMNRSCVAGLPLDLLRRSLADSSDVDQLCENCGLDLGEYSGAAEDNERSAPSLLPMLSMPALVSFEAELKVKETLGRSPSRGGSDASTDEGSASGDDSTVGSDWRGTRRRHSSCQDDDGASSVSGSETETCRPLKTVSARQQSSAMRSELPFGAVL